MLQDTPTGAVFLVHAHQAELRAAVSGHRRSAPLKPTVTRRARAIRFRPTSQPSFIVQPRPARLRKLYPTAP